MKELRLPKFLLTNQNYICVVQHEKTAENKLATKGPLLMLPQHFKTDAQKIALQVFARKVLQESESVQVHGTRRVVSLRKG